MAVCGVVAAFAAFAIVRGWSAGPWMETLLLACIAVLIAATGWIVVALATEASLHAAAFFLAPEQPPGLIRICTIMEERQTEREAATAGHPREPPPEIVTELRAIAQSGRH
jgi:hypothetical protein